MGMKYYFRVEDDFRNGYFRSGDFSNYFVNYDIIVM